MHKCTHCGHEIDEKILRSYLSSRGVEGARKKFGDHYKEEMKRRIALRWKKDTTSSNGPKLESEPSSDKQQ